MANDDDIPNSIIDNKIKKRTNTEHKGTQFKTDNQPGRQQ